MRKLISQFVLVAIAAVTLLRPTAAHGANLWIAFQAGADRWRAQNEDFFACVTGATNFNSLLSGYGAGPLHFAGDAVVTGCGASNETCTSADINCVINGASFSSMIQPGDVVLYINTGPCGGWNDNSVGVTIGGRTVPIHFGEVGQTYAGSADFHCQTAAGMHEVYEAITNGYSGDCCNHQVSFDHGSHPECAAPAGSTGQALYGEYTLRGCAGQTFEAQQLSPSGHDFDLAACTQLTVDTASLCAQPRAARDRGVCMGGNVVRCSLGPTTEDCQGLGCSDAPMPHCNSFNAQCQLAFPATMCSGATTDVSVTCANTGAVTWDGVQIGAVPQGQNSLFADSSWISPSIATSVSPSTVPMGTMGTFAFRIHAPEVLAPIHYTLAWALSVGGTYQTTPSADSLTTPITVTPCAADAGSDVVVHADSAIADGGDGGTTMRSPGCGCRTVPSRAPWQGAALLALACLLAQRRR